ncbi:MAG: ATP-binding protein [Pseudomonadota bacterium]
MRTSSVSRRLLLSVTVPLLLFFGVMVAVLDERFQALSEASLRELLQTQMVALIASIEPDADGRVAPGAQNVESRLGTPGSGLYAGIINRAGEPLWRSPSTAGTFIDFGAALAPGQRVFRYLDGARSGRLAAVSRGLTWDDEEGFSRELTFTVAASLEPYNRQLRSFRQGLLGGFAIIAALLLLTLAVLLRWVLQPLRLLGTQIRDVETGQREQLDPAWPRELSGVAANLNALLKSERTRIARYRDTLGNLAHSLKTPLAVLRAGTATRDPQALAATVNEQVDRMSAIVDRQLSRASTSGGASLGQAGVDVLPVAQDLRAALLKVHARKDFSIELQLDATVQFVGNRDDLMELLGNLMDNAAKWCTSLVRVSARRSSFTGASRRLEIVVEDDGKGIASADRDRVLQRGVRADEVEPGHGLGLAMVSETAELYGGELVVGESALGGALLLLRLPGR